MSIFTKLWDLIKAILPVLKTAAQKAFEQLPADKQQQLISISKLVEVIKQFYTANKGATTDQVIAAIEAQTGISEQDAETYLIQYLMDKGKSATSLPDAITQIWTDADTRTATGLKALWSGISNIVSEFVSAIDWESLLMGIGEYVYQTYVKGKVNI